MCTAHCLPDLVDNWFAEEKIGELRIELSSPPILDCLRRLAETAGVTVAAAVRYRVETVGNADDPRL
jgi:hypothetical protein